MARTSGSSKKPRYISPAAHADLPMAIASNHRRLHDHAIAQGKDPSDFDPLIFFANIMSDETKETDYRIVAGKTLLAYTEGPPPAIAHIAAATSMRTVNDPGDPEASEARKLAYNALLSLVTKQAATGSPSEKEVVTDIADPGVQKSDPSTINHTQSAQMRQESAANAKLQRELAKAGPTSAVDIGDSVEFITPDDKDIS